MKELIVEADRMNLPAVQNFIDEQLEEAGCPMLTQTTIDIAVEELFVNIASYAYAPGEGDAQVECALLTDPKRLLIRFRDSGVPFDPTAHEDADTSEEAIMDRIGGLGIFLVKKNMDEVSYAYEGGKNVLTLIKAV